MANLTKVRTLGANFIPITFDLTDSNNVLEVHQMQVNAVTASKPAKFNASKQMSSGDIDLTSEVTGTLPVSKGGTNSATALNNNRIMKSNAGAIEEAAAITANRALVSDANGIPTHSTVTNTELGYLGGVTSGIQAQLNALSSSYSRRTKVQSIVASDTDPSGLANGRYILALDLLTIDPAYTSAGIAKGDIFSVTTGVATKDVTPIEGYIVYVDDVNKDALYVDDGVPAWELRPIITRNHTELDNIGTNTHAQIDTHIANMAIHFEMLDEDNFASDSDTKTATQQSIKAFVLSSVSASQPNNITFSGVAGQAFDANKTYVVRKAINGESAGKIYEADSDHQNNANKFLAIGVIRPTVAVAIDDVVQIIKFKSGVTLMSGDTNFTGASDDGKLLFLNKAGAFSSNAKAGITASEVYAVNPIGIQDKYNATLTLSEYTVDCGIQGIGLDIA